MPRELSTENSRFQNPVTTVDIEKGKTSYGAYLPDLPGCVVAGETREEVIRLIHEAIEFHIEELRQDGETIPEPAPSIEIIEVAA